MNVGNSLQRGIGKHLAASYPYSAGIGVGVVAYFGCKGILRPAILKWASAPRLNRNAIRINFVYSYSVLILLVFDTVKFPQNYDTQK